MMDLQMILQDDNKLKKKMSQTSSVKEINFQSKCQ